MSRDVYLDASVLINFLATDTLFLLRYLRGYYFHVPPEVEVEVTYPDEAQRLIRGFDEGWVHRVESHAPEELLVAENLREQGLGRGEAYCASLAYHRGGMVATDDTAVPTIIHRYGVPSPMIGTVGLLGEAVASGVLPEEEAERVLRDMAAKARFLYKGIPPWCRGGC